MTDVRSLRRLRVVVTAITLLFSACHSTEKAAPARDQVLNLYSWAEYFPAGIIAKLAEGSTIGFSRSCE